MVIAAERRTQVIHAGRVIAGFALAGSVFAGLLFGWVPALAAFDVHAVGAAVGGIAGVVANARHLV